MSSVRPSEVAGTHCNVHTPHIYTQIAIGPAGAGTHDTTVTRPASRRDHRLHARRAQQVTLSGVPRESTPTRHRHVRPRGRLPRAIIPAHVTVTAWCMAETGSWRGVQYCTKDGSSRLGTRRCGAGVVSTGVEPK